MPEQKSANTASHPADTAIKQAFHAITWYRRVMRNGRIFAIIFIVTSMASITAYFLSFASAPVLSGIFVTFIGIIALIALRALFWETQRVPPLQPLSKPTDPPSAYTAHATLSSASPITIAVWSPDGQMLASADTDRAIHLWNAETGTLLHTLLPGEQPLTWSIVWSPDSQQLATSSLNGDIYLWHSQTGKLLQTLLGHQDLAWSVVWSPDSQRLASGSLDHTVCLWNAETGELLHRLSEHTDPVVTVAWFPDGQKLASGSLDHTICLWNVEEGSLLYRLSGHRGPIISLFWSLDERTLASLSHDDSIGLWKIEEVAETGSPLGRLLAWPDRRLGVLAYSPSGRTLAIGFPDHSIGLIDITTGLLTCLLEGHTNPASYLAFSSDSQLLASFALSDPQRQRGTILIWRRNANDWVKATEMLDIPVGQFITFHPELKAFATLDEFQKDVVILEKRLCSC